MPGTCDDGGMASNIAAEKTALEEKHRIREMQTMFDQNGKIELYERTEKNG